MIYLTFIHFFFASLSSSSSIFSSRFICSSEHDTSIFAWFVPSQQTAADLMKHFSHWNLCANLFAVCSGAFQCSPTFHKFSAFWFWDRTQNEICGLCGRREFNWSTDRVYLRRKQSVSHLNAVTVEATGGPHIQIEGGDDEVADRWTPSVAKPFSLSIARDIIAHILISICSSPNTHTHPHSSFGLTWTRNVHEWPIIC